MPSISDSHRPKQRISPSFEGFRPATPQSSRIKQRNRKNDTKAELALRRALWKRGLRYRLHVQGLAGTPDIVFASLKLVVFVDGDFWHGRDWKTRRKKLFKGANPDYWICKISYNRNRDRENDGKLTRMGWLVVRLWETDVKKNLEFCTDRIEQLVAKRRTCIKHCSDKALINRFSAEGMRQGF